MGQLAKSHGKMLGEKRVGRDVANLANRSTTPRQVWGCLCASHSSCPTLCDPMDCSLPGSSVHRIFQARLLEWVAISSSRGIFLTQGSNPDLQHYRQILYHLSYQRIKITFRHESFKNLHFLRKLLGPVFFFFLNCKCKPRKNMTCDLRTRGSHTRGMPRKSWVGKGWEEQEGGGRPEGCFWEECPRAKI